MSDSQNIDKALLQWNRNVNRDLPQELPEFKEERRSSAETIDLPASNWKPGILALAACVAILFLAARLMWPRPEASATAEGITAFKGMYDEVSRMFPEQSVWMSISGDDVEMEMSALPDLEQKARLVLRVALQQRGEDGTWKQVWQRDIVTSETTWVDTVSSSHPKEKLSVWMHALSQGVFVLESYLDLPPPYAVNVREQVMFTLTDEGQSVNETLLSPDMRLVQTLAEVDAEGKDA